MSAKYFQLKSFFTYWLDAVDEHSLHSPFLFDFFTRVLKKEFSHPDFEALARSRQKLATDHRVINITDFGSGSLKMKSPSRKISDIASISVTPEKYSRLYTRIIRHYNCKHILELGTSLGLNTLYLAKAQEGIRVATIEGSVETAQVAKKMLDEHGAKNVQLILGNIDQALPTYLSGSEKIDFAFIDANHRRGPTLNYFELILEKTHDETVVVLDDIHYSKEMEEAWQQIQAHKRVFTSIDLYRCGLTFFNPALTKQNAVLQF
ncbi:MAG TPA: class I SAM-dependent methyltransferase [Chryseolinea sp.]